ncbi:MAG: xylulokinase [Clostridia bacterium]|nr:xylulokinase [Clostridia bacterium]
MIARYVVAKLIKHDFTQKDKFCPYSIAYFARKVNIYSIKYKQKHPKGVICVKKYYIGADLGTSALKLLLVDFDGNVVRTVTESYPLSFPLPGFCEQSPENWWSALSRGIRKLVSKEEAPFVRAIGVAGQMHGLVILDKNDRVIRPAILWNDNRSAKETDYLNTVVGKEKLLEYTGNIAFAGFTAPKLLWMRENEKENFEKTDKIMLPKDYLTYRLTGVHASDLSDASGLLLLDCKNKRYSKEMLGICALREDQLPRLFESHERIGTLLPEIAEMLGLPEDVAVVAGAGDNAAAAIGMGCVDKGSCNISIGTSGTVFVPCEEFSSAADGAIHAFCHASGAYHLMGVALSAASCNKWFCEDILKTSDYSAEQEDITLDDLGKNHVFFLPYLMGERSPINDTDARGTFVGMRMDTARKDMLLAVLEGVAFAFRDSIDIIRDLGVRIEQSTVCGGGSKSALWCRIIANVLNIDIVIPESEQGPGYGAALLALVGAGDSESVSKCSKRFFRAKTVISPEPELVARYNERYEKFKKIYPAVREMYKEIN